MNPRNDDSQHRRDVGLLRTTLDGFPERGGKTCYSTGKCLTRYRQVFLLPEDCAPKVPLLVLENNRIRKTLSPSPDYNLKESNRLFNAHHTLIDEKLNASRISFHLLPVLSALFDVFWSCLTVTQIV